MTGARRLTAALAGLMIVQSSLGLALQAQYRDVEWIRATWYGNDWVTLTVAVPLLVLGRVGATRGSARGVLLWLGVTAYAAYNYAFYLFGAALNAFFLLYVAAVIVAAAILITALPAIDVSVVEARFHPLVPSRVLAGYFVFVALGLASVWVSMWAAYVFAGGRLPVDSDAFRLVAALDLAFLAPMLVSGGVLLWRKSAWGVPVASIASVQASIYLLVLSLNSAIAIGRGLVASPGELPLWGPLLLFTGAATVALFLSLTDGQGPRSAST